MVAKYREQGKFNFLGGPPPKDKFLGGLAAKVNWAIVQVIKAAFAGLVLPDQPAAPPHNNQPVSAATVFLSHNNQPVSAKFQTSERGLSTIK